MPELPEVETISRGLQRLIVGKTIAAVSADTPKSFPNSPADVDAFLIGSKIKSVSRRAKLLKISLSSGYSLLIHLKMTGQLVFNSAQAHFGAGHPTESLIAELPDRSTRVVINFAEGGQLFFNDQRKFGWMRLLPTEEIEQLPFVLKLGPEPLAEDFSWQLLRQRMEKRRRSLIKPVLMDQTVIAGVGNIYADESLWAAKLHPARVVESLGDSDYRRLHRSLIDMLNLSISKGGSTDRNYRTAEGKKGNYLLFANAFRREGQPCPRCHNPIVKIRLAGRGTHFCAVCQKI